uniref:Uncharacterized protein n=1 Tax=Arcella intermedia TaxID=1963864 RepID=A0A6B2LGL4_9EUKA
MELVVDKVRNVTTSVDKLEGEWDHLNSRGLWTKADDNYYMGNKDIQDYRSGLGAMALPNGDYYVGQWKGNQRHGYGKTLTGYSIKETEEVYITEWRFDEPHGYGWYFTGEGHSYVGSFLCGRQDGFGVFSWSVEAPSRETEDADKPGFAANLAKFVDSSSVGRYIHARYVGEWKLGSMHGAGLYENAHILHEGQWLEGKREGLAKITNKDTHEVVYRFFRNDNLVHDHTEEGTTQ